MTSVYVPLDEQPETSTSSTFVGSAGPPSLPREQSLVYTGKDKLFETLENTKTSLLVCNGTYVL